MEAQLSCQKERDQLREGHNGSGTRALHSSQKPPIWPVN